MKKTIIQLLLLMMILPILVNAETCDKDKISISSITIENKTDNVKELNEATASGKNINLTLSMSEVGDNIEYKLVVRNDSNEDYELGENSFNLNSDYIDYSFETEDNSNIIKPNSSKNIHLIVEYKNKVPSEEFAAGKYNYNKTVVVNLSSKNKNIIEELITNPNTKTQLYIFIIAILLIISGTTYIVLKKNKKKYIILIIGAMIIIPISVYALCNYELIINSNIQISPKEKNVKIYYSYCVSNPLSEYDLPYIEGMTGTEFMASDYMEYVPNNLLMSLFYNHAMLYEFQTSDNIKSCINSKQLILHPSNEEEREINTIYDDNLENCINDYGTLVENPNSLIYSSDEKEYIIRDHKCGNS